LEKLCGKEGNGSRKRDFEKKKEEFEVETSRSRIGRGRKEVEILGEFGRSFEGFMKELKKKKEIL